MTTWDALLAELPEAIAEEFRAYAGEDPARKTVLLENYQAKQAAFESADVQAFLNIVDEEAIHIEP